MTLETLAQFCQATVTSHYQLLGEGDFIGGKDVGDDTRDKLGGGEEEVREEGREEVRERTEEGREEVRERT